MFKMMIVKRKSKRDRTLSPKLTDKKQCVILERKEMPDSVGRLHNICDKAAKVGLRLGGFTFYSSLSFRYVSTAITVVIIVATQVTSEITHSQVICKPPIFKFQQSWLSLGDAAF